MSKRKNPEPVSGKAAGKQRMETAQELDETLESLLGGDLGDDAQALAALDGAEDPGAFGVLENAEQLVDDLVDEEAEDDEEEEDEGDDDDDDDGQESATLEPEAFEVGELPDGVSDTQLQSGEEVDLSGHVLTLPQARRVAQHLAQNSELSSVVLGDHTLNVGEMREEEELEWDSEEYTDVDAIIIAELLKTNTEVKRLDLARNQISDAGACALAAMLHENNSIEYLNLESNTFGERAGVAFCGALGFNSSVQYLNLMYNTLPTSVQDDIRKMWQDSARGQGVGLHL